MSRKLATNSAGKMRNRHHCRIGGRLDVPRDNCPADGDGMLSYLATMQAEARRSAFARAWLLAVCTMHGGPTCHSVMRPPKRRGASTVVLVSRNTRYRPRCSYGPTSDAIAATHSASTFRW